MEMATGAGKFGSRVVTLEAGMTMVITDLHGDWPLYARYRDVFLALRTQGLAETLVVAGDFIHSQGAAENDGSLAIVSDLMSLQAAMRERVIVLLGNHELPHIYRATLSKGDQVYTPRFEAAMGSQREAMLAWFSGLPFFVRSRAGVALCHAGAFEAALNPEAMATLWDFSHQRILAETLIAMPLERRPELRAGLSRLIGLSYDELAQFYHAVSNPEDPHYDDFLTGFLVGQHPDFRLLWDAFFTGNEMSYPEPEYTGYLAALLAALGEEFATQQVLVTGHIGCRNGYQLLFGGRQLRIASGVHAHPYERARYLLFDAGWPVAGGEDLMAGIGNVFGL